MTPWVREQGGALLDLDRKHFLLYGGEDVLYNVPLRRVYLELLLRIWKGWTVQWVYKGIVDLADYVGYPRERVLTSKDKDSTEGKLTPPEQKDWTNLVASVRFDEDTLRLYPLAGDVADYLSSDTKLVDNLHPGDGLQQLLLDEWTTEFPSGGFHLDLPAQRLEYWVAYDAPGIRNRIARIWPGWETRWYHDQYERQLERAEGLLRFSVPDRQTLLDCCRKMVLWERSPSPVDTVRMLAERDREQGKEVQVNPWALRNDWLELARTAWPGCPPARLGRRRPATAARPANGGGPRRGHPPWPAGPCLVTAPAQPPDHRGPRPEVSAGSGREVPPPKGDELAGVNRQLLSHPDLPVRPHRSPSESHPDPRQYPLSPAIGLVGATAHPFGPGCGQEGVLMVNMIVKLGIVAATAAGAAAVGAVVTAKSPEINGAVHTTCDAVTRTVAGAWGRVTGLFAGKQEPPCVIVVMHPACVPPALSK